MDHVSNSTHEQASVEATDFKLAIPHYLHERLEAKAKEANTTVDDFAIRCLERSIDVMTAKQTLW